MLMQSYASSLNDRSSAEISSKSSSTLSSDGELSLLREFCNGTFVCIVASGFMFISLLSMADWFDSTSPLTTLWVRISSSINSSIAARTWSSWLSYGIDSKKRINFDVCNQEPDALLNQSMKLGENRFKVANLLPLSDWRDSGKLWSRESWRLSSSRSNSSFDTLDLADCFETKATSGRNSLFGSSNSSSASAEDNITDFDAGVDEVT